MLLVWLFGCVGGEVTPVAETVPAAADPVPPGEDRALPLPSSYIPIDELAITSAGAVVATLVSVGRGEPGPPGASDYPSRWKILRTLRGDYPAEIELGFRVQTLPDEHRQRPPEIGRTYVLVSYPTNALQIASIFEGSDEPRIRALLAP